MDHDNLHLWQHGHSFGQERKRPGELRTIIVIAVTATMMVVEITTGILFGSMALLADGLHMASHAAALSISAFAYSYARRHAHDQRYSFGTGKVNSLGGFTGAVLLAIFALLAGKYYGLIWMDPLMGVVGAILVARWSLGLLHTTGAVLLDRQGPEQIRNAIRESIESEGGDRVIDLHLWSIGPNIYAVELTIVSHNPQSPDHYKDALPKETGLAHVNIEVHRSVHEDERKETNPLSSSLSSGNPP